mgnify:CR=1 FL=1
MSIKNQTHVVLTNPNDRYEPYTSTTPQATVARLQGYTDVANNASQKNILVDSDGHLQVDIVSGGGGGGGDATAANQTTMISHLSDIDSAVTGTLSVSDSTAQGSLSTLAGAVVGSEMQVDIVSAPTLNVSDSTAQGSLSTLAGAVAGSELQVDIVSAPTLNVSDSAAQSSLSTLAGAVAGSEMQVDVVSTVLPSGAATSANQATANASLSSISSNTANIPSSGQDVMNNSLPVVIASDQTDVKIKLATVANYGTHGNMINGSTLNAGSQTTAVDIQNMNRSNLFYEDTATSSVDGLNVLGSINGTDYYVIANLFPMNNAGNTKREASYTSLFLDGLKYLKLENTSSSDNYTAATGTICGTPS